MRADGGSPRKNGRRGGGASSGDGEAEACDYRSGRTGEGAAPADLCLWAIIAGDFQRRRDSRDDSALQTSEDTWKIKKFPDIVVEKIRTNVLCIG